MPSAPEVCSHLYKYKLGHNPNQGCERPCQLGYMTNSTTSQGIPKNPCACSKIHIVKYPKISNLRYPSETSADLCTSIWNRRRVVCFILHTRTNTFQSSLTYRAIDRAGRACWRLRQQLVKPLAHRVGKRAARGSWHTFARARFGTPLSPSCPVTVPATA